MIKAFGSAVVNGLHQLMGNHYSVFVTALRNGDVKLANDIYYNKKKIRESVRPNEPISGDPKDNTILHYVAVLNLQTVYDDLLRTGSGMPDVRNSERQNCLHLICEGPQHKIKRDMLLVTLEIGLEGMDLKHVLNEKDNDGNTVLHVAARRGLDDCVDLLLDKGADLSATNTAKETPADVALRAGHTDLATRLETKVVFEGDDPVMTVDPDPEMLQEIAAGTKGLKDNELRSMKDQLLIETANMLGVSLLTSQVLLREHDWSKEALLEAWMEDPAAVCEKAGVDLPQESGTDLVEHAAVRSDTVRSEGERECGVCLLSAPPDVVVPCQHHFCSDCWKQYLEDKIAGGETQRIVCPDYGCYRPVPLDIIEHVVSQEMARKFLSFDIKAFVDSNPNIRWCPHAGCGQAVTLATDTVTTTTETPEVTVHCNNDHYFCWSCLRGPHDPCSCEVWSKWLDHVEEMRPRCGTTTAAEADEAASSRWLADRSKPCPKCKSPIEKTEGCNHMCCKKCKHDFCWVCLDNWKCHNSSTGGYFECNRYDAQKKATVLLDQRRDSYYGNAKELEAVSRFLHYYERYKEHLNSLELEEPFLDKARDKMQLLAQSVQGMDGVSTDELSFIEDAVRELLKCRRVLQATYPFAYYLRVIHKRREFERLQGALEQVTEMLAEVVARPHLRKPRSEIIRLTHEARTKRTMLLDAKERLTPQLRRQLPVPDDTDSEPEDSDVTAFIRMLEGMRSHDSRPRSHDRSHDWRLRDESSHGRSRDQGREDEELLRALEISRQEFEADRQLKEDIEKAKAQSMASPNEVTIEPQTTPPDMDWVRRLDSDYEESLSWPVLRLSTPPHSPPDSPPHTPYTPHMPHTPHTPHTAEADEWGPLVSEDDDLARALELSLQQSNGSAGMMHIAGPQVVDSNKLEEGNMYGLPPELQHLLDTRRSGEHV